MERIANYKCARITRKFRRSMSYLMKVAPSGSCSMLTVLEVGVEKPFENRIQILDVLLGPLNLEP